MRYRTLCALLAATTLVFGVDADENAVYSEVFSHYEAIRQVLIEDSTDGVANHARAIADAAAELEREFSPSAAGVDARSSGTVKELLPEIEKRAQRMAEASDLAGVRFELAELTKPLARWHELVEGSRPVVAYCPMEKKAWLQPDELIGNPYAPYMLRCGEVVQR